MQVLLLGDSIASFDGTSAGTKVNKGEVMFPRIDVEAKIEELDKLVEEQRKLTRKPTIEPVKEEITIEDFDKIDMRVVKVLDCVPMKKSKKLLKLKVDLGGEVRQVISGIAQNYKSEDLIGKYVVLVANLKPVTLRGELSQGMIIAAATGDNSKLFAISVPGEFPTGSTVR